MKLSFVATIAFALLGLGFTFIANLIGWMATGEPLHQAGVVTAVMAAGAAYGGQAMFTSAASWLAQHQYQTAPRHAGPSHPDAFENYQQRHRAGHMLQAVSVVCCAAALVAFIVGG